MFFLFRFLFRKFPSKTIHDEESAPLLNDNPVEPDPNYGSTEKGKAKEEKGLEEKDNWIAYIRRFSTFIPYIWPSNNLRLQLSLTCIVICLLISRFTRVLAPYQLGVLIGALGSSITHFPLRQFILYILLDWIDSARVLDFVRDYLWLPVEQAAYKSITTAAYRRVMTLSSDFHDNKKSGEIFKSIDQGKTLYSLLNEILFEVVPSLCDLLIACAYLSYLFGWYMSILVCTSSVGYIWTSKYFTKKVLGLIRLRSAANRAENQILHDTVRCWVSVAYFNSLEHEQKRYTEAIVQTLANDRQLELMWYLGDLAKKSMLEIGFTGATGLAAYQVFNRTLGVESFVVLLSYWAKFTGNSYAHYLYTHLTR